MLHHAWITEDGTVLKKGSSLIFQRPLFRHYYKGTDAVVIVIDTADVHRLDELYCDVLKPALLAEELANSVFLFLANKKDLPDTIGMEDLVTVLNLKAVKHTWSKLIIAIKDVFSLINIRQVQREMFSLGTW